MAFAATTLADYLTAVVARIISTSGIFSAANCYIALARPEPGWGAGTIHSLTCIVYPGPGQFESDVMTGGGRNQVWWRGTITAEIISPIKLDQQGREKEFLTHSDKGVLVGVQKVLKALAIHDPVVGSDNVAIDPIMPENTSQVIRDEGNFGSIALSFEASFKWSLS